jgi:uncharacterized protein (TIGR02246 family)
MKRLAALGCAAVLALMAAACNQSASTHDAEIQTIKNIEAQWNQDYASKDAEKIASHYATDAVLMVPGMAPTSGYDAIHTALEQMVTDPAMALKFQASKVEVSKSGDLAYTQGSYTLTVTDPQTKKIINDHGSYVTVYRKMASGLWKAVSDIASSAVPPPAPKPAITPHKARKEHKASVPQKKKHHK